MCRISIGKISVYWLGSLKLLAKNLRDGIKNNMFHTEERAVLHYLKRWMAANFHKPKITFICEFAHIFLSVTANPEAVGTLKFSSMLPNYVFHIILSDWENKSNLGFAANQRFPPFHCRKLFPVCSSKKRNPWRSWTVICKFILKIGNQKYSN